MMACFSFLFPKSALSNIFKPTYLSLYDYRKDMDEPVLIRRKGNILPKFEKSKG